MTKYILLFLLPLLSLANQITVEHPQIKPLGEIIQTNAQITQLSDQKQEIVSRLSGHIETYFVKAGERVQKGERVALIESIELSKMSAQYLAIVKQTKASKLQLDTAKKLYKKGLASQNDLSNQVIALEEIHSKQNTLASQLKSLGVTPSKLAKATDELILYAHADGIVGQIVAPLHSNVDEKTVLMTLVNQSSYYATAFLSVDDAMQISSETTGWISVSGNQYPCSFVQLLPNIDEKTQRAKVLFSIEKSPTNLLIGAYVQMEISLPPTRNILMVKKSALTLFQGEWVVFVSAHHEEHPSEAHIENENTEHDEHDEEEESPYQPKVVNIIAYSGEWVAIEGIEAKEEYVSSGVYFVKSMMLKSSLGEHGH